MLATTMAQAWQRREASGGAVAEAHGGSTYDELYLNAIATGSNGAPDTITIVDCEDFTIVVCTVSTPNTIHCPETANCA